VINKDYDSILNEAKSKDERIDLALLILILMELRANAKTSEPSEDKEQSGVRSRPRRRVQGKDDGR